MPGIESYSRSGKNSENVMTVDEAAETLFGIMRKDFNKQFLVRLSAVSGLDITRAETELIFLDFFAVYFSLKFTRSSGWSEKGNVVFEQLYSLLCNWLGTIWESMGCGTKADAFRVIDARLKTYGERIEQPNSEDPDSMLASLGEAFALYTLTDDTFYGSDGSPKPDRFPDVLMRLGQDYDRVAITVGGEVVDHRVHSLHAMFDLYKVK